MSATASREHLLEAAFVEIPSKIGPFTLRPLSAGSFALLGRIGNPMITGGDESAIGNEAMMTAIAEFVWAHTAPLDRVRSIQAREDLPAAEVDEIAWQLSLPDITAFLKGFKATAARMAAGLAEPDDEESEADAGKPPAPFRAGSPVSSSPSGPPETPAGNGTSSGTPPSSVPSDISTPPGSPPEASASGPAPPMPMPEGSVTLP